MTGTSPHVAACEEMRLLIQADLDGELDAAAAAVLAGHVRDCPGCSELAAELGVLARETRGVLREEAAPARLREMLEARLVPAVVVPVRRWRWPALGFAAGAVCAAVLLMAVPRGDGLAGELVSGHVRALQAGHLLDVPSSDRHTVKPWFEGRVDFAPPVPDFSAQGFVLEGGRLDVIGGRAVAVLVYRRDKHPINVFVWPAGGARAGAVTRDGYAVREWEQGGLGFHAVSDLEAGELEVFVRLFQAG